MNVRAQGIFPSLPCPNPKYCACPGIGNCLPIVANDELFENILLIPIWLISVYMICTVSLKHYLTVKLDAVIWRDFWFASKIKKLICIVWQYSSESEKRLKNRLAGCHRSSRWLLLDYWLPENSSNRSRWRKNKCEDLPPATHGESRARPPLEIAPRTSTWWCCSWGSWPGASWLRWCELTRATQHTKARPPSCGLHIFWKISAPVMYTQDLWVCMAR